MARTRTQLDLRTVAEALADPSLEGTSMAAIARRLRVAKPTLYRMAGSREELIGISIDSETERLLEQIHWHGLPGVFHFAQDSPAGFRLLFGDRYPEARHAVRRVENRLARDTSEIVAAGSLGLAVGIARRAMEDGEPARPELLGSVFDAVAKTAAEISDAKS